MTHVICISGPPGAGKTTLATALARALDCPFVSYDRYETFTQQSVSDIQTWLAAGAPFEAVTAPGFSDALRRGAATGGVVCDSPFGRAHPDYGMLITYSIWVACPWDLALARKLLQLTQDTEPGQAPSLDWVMGYLSSYPLTVRPALEMQEARVKPTCDLCISAQDSVQTALNRVLAQIPFTKQ